MSLIIMSGTNMMIQSSLQGAKSRELYIFISVLFSIMALVGIISGVIALFGVRRYGRKGILWPALIGITIWLLLPALAFPALYRVSQLTKQAAAAQKSTSLSAVQHITNATPVQLTERGNR